MSHSDIHIQLVDSFCDRLKQNVNDYLVSEYPIDEFHARSDLIWNEVEKVGLFHDVVAAMLEQIGEIEETEEEEPIEKEEKKKLWVTAIEWDLNDEDDSFTEKEKVILRNRLNEEYVHRVYEYVYDEEEEVADTISNWSGYCVHSFEYRLEP